MWKRVFAAAAVLLLAVSIINLPLFNKFTISNGKTGEIVYIDDIANVRNFYISFRHSVNRTPVNEFYEIRNNKFFVYKTTFYSYGAGMPEYDPESDQKVTIENGLVQIENINREMDSFTILIGTYADHHFNYGNKSLKLSQYVPSQNPAKLRVKSVSILELMKFGLKYSPVRQSRNLKEGCQ